MTVREPPPRPNVLARALRGFFAEHLSRLRGMSPNTIHSYRDSLTLLLRFVSSQCGKPVVALDLNDVDPDTVVAFLHYLERDRRNTATTRNVRLAAIHAFFEHLAGQYPDRLEHSQRILAIPFKRAQSRPVEHLEYEEIQAVLAAVDRRSPDGRRDYALLAALFNTGARVEEIVSLRPCDLQLVRPCHARLLGKGRKERLCPLWPQTVELLGGMLAERGVDPQSTDPLFRNHRGEPLTRFGVRYILAKHCERARQSTPSLRRKRLHPHSMRHSTAIHLLKSGVDLVTISHWLGHASVNTTNRYAKFDLEMKREALAKIQPVAGVISTTVWRPDPSILAWLEAL